MRIIGRELKDVVGDVLRAEHGYSKEAVAVAHRQHDMEIVRLWERGKSATEIAAMLAEYDAAALAHHAVSVALTV